MTDALIRAQVTARLALTDGHVLMADDLAELGRIEAEYTDDPGELGFLDRLSQARLGRLEVISDSYYHYLSAVQGLWGNPNLYPSAWSN